MVAAFAAQTSDGCGEGARYLAMPWSHDPRFNALRMRYKSAFEAHRHHHRALIEATMRGEVSAELIEAEERARLQMNEVRAELLAAMAQATSE